MIFYYMSYCLCFFHTLVQGFNSSWRFFDPSLLFSFFFFFSISCSGFSIISTLLLIHFVFLYSIGVTFADNLLTCVEARLICLMSQFVTVPLIIYSAIVRTVLTILV